MEKRIPNRRQLLGRCSPLILNAMLPPVPHMLISKPTAARSLTAWSRGMREFQLDDIFDTSVLGRSYEYQSMIAIHKKEIDHIAATVVGRSYMITIALSDQRVIASCTCPHTAACKHIAATILKLRQKADEEE